MGLFIFLLLAMELSPEQAFQLELPKEELLGHINPNYGVCEFTEDRIYFWDTSTSRIHIYATDGSYISSFVDQGTGPGEIQKVSSFAVGTKFLVVTDEGSPARYTIYDQDGTYKKVVNLPAGQMFEFGSSPVIYKDKYLVSSYRWGYKPNGERIVIRDLQTGKIVGTHGAHNPYAMQASGWVQTRIVNDEIWLDQPYARSIQVIHPEKGLLREIEIPFGDEETWDIKKFNNMVSSGHGLDADDYFTNNCRLKYHMWVTNKHIITLENEVGRYPKIGAYDLKGKLLGRKQLIIDGRENQLGYPIAVKDGMLVFINEGEGESAPVITFANLSF